jgi:hypothetical protein
MIEMFSGMGTPQSLEVVTGNKKQHTASESKLVRISEMLNIVAKLTPRL